jgi:outer membrane protein OmpA-like peptidoglycan-associated protein
MRIFCNLGFRAEAGVVWMYKRPSIEDRTVPGKKVAISTLVLAGLTLTACSYADGTRNNTATQAVAGTATGAVIGNLIGGDEQSTIIGGVVGGIAGTALGSHLDRQQRELQASIGGSGAGIVNTGNSLVVSLPEAITFAVDSSDVKPTIRDDLIAVSQNLQKYPDSTVQIMGNTDSTGSAAYNQSLSERRAQAVTNILVASGTPAWRVQSYGRGASQPVASNETAEGRAANRRVEIIITPNSRT